MSFRGMKYFQSLHKFHAKIGQLKKKKHQRGYIFMCFINLGIVKEIDVYERNSDNNDHQTRQLSV